MTLPEAAALLAVTPATLRQQIAAGSLRAKKVGRDWHVTPREIERYRAASLGKPGRRRQQRCGLCGGFIHGGTNRCRRCGARFAVE